MVPLCHKWLYDVRKQRFRRDIPPVWQSRAWFTLTTTPLQSENCQLWKEPWWMAIGMLHDVAMVIFAGDTRKKVIDQNGDRGRPSGQSGGVASSPWHLGCRKEASSPGVQKLEVLLRLDHRFGWPHILDTQTYLVSARLNQRRIISNWDDGNFCKQNRSAFRGRGRYSRHPLGNIPGFLLT